ncbi:MAG: OmpH family outer membrane protein [bacterium]|nr:OmpH family outer membrane protein [bacterium]
MRKKIIALAFVMSYFISTAVAEEFKVAIVDVPTVVNSSKQFQALQKEQQQKTTELHNWLKKVKTDVDKQKTKESKEALIKKYNTEFAKKQDAMKKNYITKMQAIDKNITATITEQAKANGYSLVLTKGTVLYGGDDITKVLTEKVK